MILDEALSFDEHIDHLHRKVANRMGILRCSRKFLDVPHRVMLYKSLICSYIDFGDIVYTTSSADNLKRLQTLQNTACKIILRRDNRAPTFKLHVDLNLLPLHLRRHIRVVCECFMSVHEESYCLRDFFVPVVRPSGPRTRGVNRNIIKVPKCNTNAGQRAFSYTGPAVWNKVPPSFQSIESYESFKKAYSRYVLDKFVRGESQDFPT